ncbi:hypothetical protein EVAR_68239_1 [Eumeta japonica]|uniref:Mos1 transposase HTH domain-containing protein n=1 Tax=Eumeta variegata TaxID=151549 RepID=A0A4C1ZTD3_EUMVA|nr:hypothetical protein EVAR_68239_1 [Eumeta japonica]
MRLSPLRYKSARSGRFPHFLNAGDAKCVSVKQLMYLKRGHFRAMTCYGFKVGLSEDQCMLRLRSKFNNEAPSRASVFLLREFRNGRNSLFKMKNTWVGRFQQACFQVMSPVLVK